MKGSRFPIQPGEIQIWHSSITELVRSLSQTQIESTLSAKELETLRGLWNVKVRNEYLAARFMIRSLLSYYRPDVAPGVWSFAANQYGKPTVDCALGRQQLEFNISHSGDVILCAFSLGVTVGIDVEARDRKGSWLEMAKDSFSVSEARALESLPDDEIPHRFFEIWTLKEAFIKAVGMGLSFPLGDFSFQLANRADIQVEFAAGVEQDSAAWQFQLFEIEEGYQCALALHMKRGQAISILQMGDLLQSRKAKSAA